MTRRFWWLRLRDQLIPVVLLTVVALFVGFAGLTWRPEAPVWDRVEATPMLGDVVARVRSRYRLPPEVAAGGPSERRRATADSDLVASAAGGVDADIEYVGVGARLHTRPGADSEVIEQTRSLRDYRVVERRGSWARLVLGVIDDVERTAWVDLTAERDMSRPPLGNAPEPPKPQAASPASAAQIAAVMEHLEQPMDQSKVGGYTLLLGFRDPALRAALGAELRNAEILYSRRFRLAPVGEPAETVVVFGAEESYRAFQETAPRIAGLRSAGHSSRGLIALFKGRRSQGDVLETVRHEVAHLLNRRALGPALPPWLEEGVADELALLTDLRGDDPFARYRFRLGNQTLYRGPLASLRLLLETESSGQWISLQQMLGMDWDQFVRGGRSPLLYAQSSFFVHWLMSGDRQDAFHRYLTSISVGRPATAGELSRALGAGIGELDSEFRQWLRGWREVAGQAAEPQDQM